MRESGRIKNVPSNDLTCHLGAFVSVLAGESKIGNLESAVSGDEQVVGLHILSSSELSGQLIQQPVQSRGAHPMQNPIAMAKLQTFEGHEHPALDVCSLEHERVVLDDGFQVCIEELEHEVEVGLVGEDVKELSTKARSAKRTREGDEEEAPTSITFGCRSSRRNLTSRMADMSRPSLNWPTLIYERGR